MATAHVNGIDVYYERSGHGPRLLFCNGSGATVETSRFLVDVLGEGCDVVVHDQRGLGRTSIPPGPYTMADYATDALGVLDAVGWEACRVVGVSFGGMVAQELAVTAPERVEKLALVCTSPGGRELSSYPLHELESLPAERRAEVALSLLDTRFSPEWLAEHPGDRMLAAEMAKRREGDKSDEQLRGEREQLLARSHHDVTDRLHRVACPTLVAGGRYDGIAPPANSEAIAARIPGAELRFYEGGHAFFAQDASAIADLIAFLTT